MNLIVCHDNCKHQQEGYCTLNDITKATNNGNQHCVYYDPTFFEDDDIVNHSDGIMHP